jgi:hypothetical protein
VLQHGPRCNLCRDGLARARFCQLEAEALSAARARDEQAAANHALAALQVRRLTRRRRRRRVAHTGCSALRCTPRRGRAAAARCGHWFGRALRRVILRVPQHRARVRACVRAYS